ALHRAIAGAEGFYYLIPPAPGANDTLAVGRRLIDTLRDVLSRSDVPHIAYLSSIGAQHESGTGPIRNHYYGETALRSLPTRFTFVRAGYFMENTAALVPLMKAQGILPAFFSPNKKIPMVATKDIGETAVQALL